MRHAIVFLILAVAVGCNPARTPEPAPPAPAAKTMTAVDWFARGNDLREDDKPKAVDAYSEAIKLDGKMDAAYFNRALTYAELGRNDEAVADLKTLTERKSGYAAKLTGLFAMMAPVSADLGDQAVQAGKFDEALAKYHVALTYNPKFANAYIGRGIVYASTKKPAEAEAAFDKAIELSPKSAVAYHNRGKLFLEQKEWKKSIADFSQVIALEPDGAAAFSLRALAYEGLGDAAQAEKDRAMATQLSKKQN